MACKKKQSTYKHDNNNIIIIAYSAQINIRIWSNARYI